MLRKNRTHINRFMRIEIELTGVFALDDSDNAHTEFMRKSGERVGRFVMEMFSDLAGTRIMSQEELDYALNPYRRAEYPPFYIEGSERTAMIELGLQLRSQPYVINRQTGLFHDTAKFAQSGDSAIFELRFTSDAPYSDALTEIGTNNMIGRPVWTRVAEATQASMQLHDFPGARSGENLAERLAEWYAQFLGTGQP